MKEFNDQILKFQITDDELIMKMSIKDLVWLFEESPNNTYDGENIGCKVRTDKVQEFAEFIVRQLMDGAPYEQDDMRWSVPFTQAFNEILEGAEDDICEYFDESREDDEDDD